MDDMIENVSYSKASLVVNLIQVAVVLRRANLGLSRNIRSHIIDYMSGYLTASVF